MRFTLQAHEGDNLVLERSYQWESTDDNLESAQKAIIIFIADAEQYSKEEGEAFQGSDIDEPNPDTHVMTPHENDL